MAETLVDLAAALGIDLDYESVKKAEVAIKSIETQLRAMALQAELASKAAAKALSTIALGAFEVAKDTKKATDDGITALWTKLRNLWVVTKAVQGFNGLVGMGKRAIEAGAEFGDLADKTGMAVEEIQEWGYAAGVHGLSTQFLTTTIGKLNTTLDKAAKSGGELAEPFKKAGIAIKDAEGKVRPAGDVMGDIADRLAALSEDERPAEAVKLLGKAGRELIPLLKEGSAGVEKLRQEAHELGLVMDQETVDAMDKVGKNVKRLELAWDGLKKNAIATLVPELQKLTEALLAWYKANRKDISKAIHGTFVLVLGVVKALAKGVMLLVKAFAWLIKYRGIIIPFLAAAALAFVALRKEMTLTGLAAVKAGAMTMWAWIKALAPVVAVAAAFTALFLLIEDLYLWMSGEKGTLMGEFFGDVEDNKFAQGIKQVFFTIFDIVGAIIKKIEGIIQAAKDAWAWVTGRDEETRIISEQAKKEGMSDEQINVMMRDHSRGRDNKDYNRLFQKTLVAPMDIPITEDPLTGMTNLQTTPVTINNSIVVNGGDPEKMKQAALEVQARSNRQFEAQVGGGKKR